MSKLREIENPNALTINAVYYKGKKKKEFLGNRNKTLSQLPKGIVLGFCYTISSLSIGDYNKHHDTVTEYVFMKSLIKNDDGIFFEKLSEMIFCEKGKDSNGVELDDYVKELETSGFIKMPTTFRSEKSSEDIMNELGLAKNFNTSNVDNEMNKLIEIENPDAMGINAIYYEGEKKREFLGNRQRVLSKIPQTSILGFAYTVSGFDLHDGKSMDDTEHSDAVTEYVFMQKKGLFKDEICFEKISEMVFCEKSKDSNCVQLDDYLKELKTSGYIKMPITFRWGTLPEKIVEDFSLAKRLK